MGIEIFGSVSRVSRNLGDGSNEALQLLRGGEQAVSDVHAKYQEMSFRGNLWTGANLGGTPVTTQAGLSATTPALTLFNPASSGVNLVLVTATVSITSSPAAAAAVWLAYNLVTAAAPTATTAANVTNAFLGGAQTPRGQCSRIATLAAAPLVFRSIGGVTGASSISPYSLIDHVDGEAVIPPGVAVSIQTSAAMAVVGSFTWEEIAI